MPKIGAVRDRVELLTRLRWVGPGLLTALAGLTVAVSAVPAATAVAVGWLIDRLAAADPGGLRAAAITPLIAYAAVLLGGHLLAAARAPLAYLAEARVDGRHRAELARLAASSPTIGALERPEVQVLIRTARADPESFMDGTPGAGALAQLDLIGRSLALAGAGLVLAAYAWWVLPVLLAAAVAVHQLRWREGVQRRQVWRGVLMPSMRADMWSDALVSPAEGKEIRIFGLGEWALDRIDRHLRAGFDPLWPVERRILAAQWRQAALVLVPLGIVYVVVASDAAGGGATVAVATAALVAGLAVFEAFDDAPRATINAITCIQAFTRLRAELRVEQDVAGRPMPKTGRPPLVRFEGLRFRYPETEPWVLDGVDLEIRPGELLGIVGVNGAGKSTLIKLLAGLYEPTAGRITADGVDLAEAGPAAWRQRIAVVFQDFVRYHLSAADNVTPRQRRSPSPTRRSWPRRPGTPGSTRWWRGCRAGGRRRWPGPAPAGWTCPAASGSRWRWPAPSTRCAPVAACWCWTSRPRTSTSGPSGTCSPGSPPTAATPRWCSSRTGCPRSAGPTGSCCSAAAGSPRPAATTS